MTANVDLLERTRERLLSGRGRLLVIQTAFLGDVILLTPLLRAARRAFPEAALKAVTIPECLPIVEAMADEVIPFDKRRRKGRGSRWRQLIRRLRSEEFDAALIPHRSLRSGITAMKGGIACRIGFSRGAGSWFHSMRVPYRMELYEGNRNLELLKPLAAVEDDGMPELHPSAADEQVVDGLMRRLGLTENGFVVIAPGSLWETKRWSEKYYHNVSRRLTQDHNLPTVAIGGAEDAAVCRAAVVNPHHSLVGKLSLMQSACLISMARLVVSGDTAPAHIATAMKTRQLIIYGSTVPGFGFAPPTDRSRTVGLDLWCRPCTGHGRNFCLNLGSYRCLKVITAELVVERIKDWL